MTNCLLSSERKRKMEHSERRLRRLDSEHPSVEKIEEMDKQFAERIVSTLKDPLVDTDCMVDEFCFDFSEIPINLRERFELCMDSY